MAYEIKADVTDHTSLAVWLVCMQGNTVDVLPDEGSAFAGQIVRVKPHDKPATVTFGQVDLTGKLVLNGWLRTVEVDDIKMVYVW